MKHNIIIVLCNILTIIWFKIGTVEGIVGGTEANSREFNYIVSVQADGKHVCGGCIIGMQHILSAAHCFIGDDGNFRQHKFTIVMGAVNLNVPDSIRTDIEIEAIYVPREYEVKMPEENFRNEVADIAVLKLVCMIGNCANSQWSIIDLPTRSKKQNFPSYYNEHAILFGFGVHDTNRGTSNNDRNALLTQYEYTPILRHTKTIIINKSSCSFPVDYKKVICAQALQDNHKGACEGDTGGPIIYNGNTVIGVLAQYRMGCQEFYGASIYTRVSNYVAFINRSMSGKTRPDMRVAIYNKNANTSGGKVSLVEST